MKRWNIEKILLYSHDEKIEELHFDLGKVNIITGDSRTGKSAIPEIIDYVMGSSKCHIPIYVKNCLSWVGIVWAKNDSKFAIFRKIPNIGKKSSEDMYFESGTNIKVPQKASMLKKITNLEGGLRKFEQIIGIGDATTESFGRKNSSKRITIRNTMPYILQDDDVIISKSVLLRGSGESERKQSMLESLPYFLGIVDETTLEKELEYKKIVRQINRTQKELSLEQSILGNNDITAINLIQESSQLGLCKPLVEGTKHSEEEIEKTLENILKWNIEDETVIMEDQLLELHEALATEQSKVIELKNKVRFARNKMSDASEFEHSVRKQGKKLEVVNIFKNPKDVHICPICKNEISDEIISISSINKHIDKVKKDLISVEKEKPRLDSYIRKLNEEILKAELNTNELKNKIMTLVKENEQAHSNLNTLQRQYKTLGRVSLYMEAKEKNVMKKEVNVISDLQSRLTQLSEEIDLTEKLEALENIERRISATASSIISKLPFDKRYDDSPIFLNLKNLEAGISLPTHSESMRDVGSDENYLSMHVSLLLAMHRQFANLNAPVPGLILFDQLSRPYFPPDKEKNEVQITEADNDRESLLQYFNCLFDEVEKQESLQIIVLEHAYFKDDIRYKTAVKYRWKKDISGLIPEGWPEKKMK